MQAALPDGVLTRRTPRARATDAVILVMTDLDSDLGAELRRLHVPAVLIDPAGVPALDVPTIGATNWAGALAATEHLVELGQRRVAHVSGRPGLWCSRSRLDGYRAGLGAAGIEPAAPLVVEGAFDYVSGYRAGAQLMALDDPPTAVFAASDQMAMGVYEAVRKAGGRVPDDLSVVGFDDLPEARWTSPPDDGAPALERDGADGSPDGVAHGRRRGDGRPEARAHD